MTEQKTNVYEGMFLFPQAASSNLQEAVDHLKEILSRADAELLSLSKWDERRLAYEIRGNKRGIYFLAHFRAAPDRLTSIERDANLSEKVLRAMVTRADHLSEDEMRASDAQQRIADEIRVRSEGGDEAPASAAPAPASAAPAPASAAPAPASAAPAPASAAPAPAPAAPAAPAEPAPRAEPAAPEAPAAPAATEGAS